SSTGAVSITPHTQHLQVRRRRRESVRPNDDRVPPCTAALPYRFPALLHTGVLPWHIPPCLLLPPLPPTPLTVCAHRFLASLCWFSTPPSGLAASHTVPPLARGVPARKPGTP